MIGRVLDGRFTIVSRLGAGSMGTVYRAKQHAMGRDVAIKILRSDRALDDAARARFLREARANSLLASPHTVTVFDFGQADNGDFFLAMELLEGESVGQRIQRMKRLPVELAIDTARQALRSLSEAHAKGIIHRDLKPDNLFYAKVLTGGGGAHNDNERQHEEIVKVLDFGIAKMLHDENRAMNAVETQAGTVFGTPRYMSPEQAQGKPLDARSDLYSLGVILYHMITGRPPFTDDDAIVVMARHIKTAPKPPSEACPQAHIPPEIEAVLLRVLAKEPAQRPSNAEAMAQELARALAASATATSGVRISLSGVTLPPPSSRAGLPMTAPSVQDLPSAPLSGGDVAAMAAASPALESIELAEAGIRTPRRRRRRALLLGSFIGLAAIGAILVAVRTAAPRRAPMHVWVDSPSRAGAPASAAAAAQVAPTAIAPTSPPGSTASTTSTASGASGAASTASPPSAASATGTAKTGPASTSSGGAAAASPPPVPPTKTTTFSELPRATSKPPSVAKPPPRPAQSKPSAPPAPAPTPSTTSTGHYGLFE